MRASNVLTAILGCGLLALSYRSVASPRAAARAYGVPLPDEIGTTPYMLVKADRDATLGIMLLILARVADAKTLAAALVCGAIAPVSDAAIVLRNGRARDTAIHVATAAYLLVSALLAATDK